MQDYTDDTAELRRQLDALGGMAALQDPERQLQAIMELEQFVSAVSTHQPRVDKQIADLHSVPKPVQPCYRVSLILRAKQDSRCH